LAFLLAFFPAFCFVGRPALVFAPLASFWPLGALYLLLAPFFEAVGSGASTAPCSATTAALSVGSALVMLVILFCASVAHDDSSL
jgi:hypothetical protein